MLGLRRGESVKKGDYAESWEESVPRVEPKGIVNKETKAIFRELAEQHGVHQRKLQTKMDFVILSPICLLYLLAYLDRLNISNANVYGMSNDLGLDSMQYSVALAVFFVPYVVFELPGNYLLKMFSPHLVLSVLITIFGCVSLSQGFVQNYHGLIVCRVLLGFAEAPMLPACYYLLGSWYTRAEAQKRYSFFFSSTSLAGAFGGLIAYGMNTIDMHRGLEGWRWLFIVEGAITAFCGLCLFFVIADFPETAKFLKRNEREYIKAKLAIDQGDSSYEHKPTAKGLAMVFKDPKIVLSGVMYFGLIITIYGYAYFSIAIINTFGYSPVQTQVHSIYPWITSFGMNIVVASFSDLTRHRYFYTLACSIISLVGLAMLLGTDPTEKYVNVRYASCFLVAVGVYCAGPILVCWTTMNVVGHTRKMVNSAFTISFGNIGGIISTFSYKSEDAPAYRTGLWVSLATVLLSIGASALYLTLVHLENQKKRRNLREFERGWDAMSPEERNEKGELNPKFWYMY